MENFNTDSVHINFCLYKFGALFVLLIFMLHKVSDNRNEELIKNSFAI